jgi:hypothetical protein
MDLDLDYECYDNDNHDKVYYCAERKTENVIFRLKPKKLHVKISDNGQYLKIVDIGQATHTNCQQYNSNMDKIKLDFYQSINENLYIKIKNFEGDKHKVMVCFVKQI